MTSHEYGDVVLVPVPFTDQSGRKRRPAVVVSSAAYQAARPDVVVMPISTMIADASRFGEVLIRDWKIAGLHRPSVVKPVLVTVEAGLVVRRLGRLEPQDRRTLAQAMNNLLGE